MKSIKEYIAEWNKENSITTYGDVKNSANIVPENLGMNYVEAKIFEEIKQSDLKRLKSM
jgi:hypothetical protein